MESPDVPVLETERLRLRAFRRSDFEDYAALKADPEVQRYLSESWDRGRSWRHLAFLVGHWQLGGAGIWAVEQRETGAFLGIVGFCEPEGWPGFELAWTLARRWWGMGYATEGARAALDHAFNVWEPGAGHQPHRPGEPRLHPRGRAHRREPARLYSSSRQGDAVLRHRPGELRAVPVDPFLQSECLAGQAPATRACPKAVPDGSVLGLGGRRHPSRLSMNASTVSPFGGGLPPSVSGILHDHR